MHKRHKRARLGPAWSRGLNSELGTNLGAPSHNPEIIHASAVQLHFTNLNLEPQNQPPDCSDGCIVIESHRLQSCLSLR